MVLAKFLNERERVVGSFARVVQDEMKLVVDHGAFELRSRIEVGRVNAAGGKNVRACPQCLRGGTNDQNFCRQSRRGVKKTVLGEATLTGNEGIFLGEVVQTETRVLRGKILSK